MFRHLRAWVRRGRLDDELRDELAQHVEWATERLIAEGKMHESGLREVERAKADGRWERAYDSPKDMQVPQDFLDELEKHPKAKEFFATLNKSNRYAIAFRLHDAKRPETRVRRMEQFIAMLSEGRKLY